MVENKDLPELSFEDDFVRKITEAENRYCQEITITNVQGECPYGHVKGDVFRVTNCNSDGLCGALYKAIHSQIITLHYGGSLPWEKTPDGFRGLCPEMGKVSVSVKRIEKGDFTFFKTLPPPKDMTKKGFPGIDKYRLTIEIIGLENECAWGHSPGKRYEVDPFNTGGVCGYLYSRVYDFINLYNSGANLPWEFEENTIMSVCPDSYNLISFRLIRELRST
jgi:uncharacterized repeat protein (TIGR04076 family)